MFLTCETHVLTVIMANCLSTARVILLEYYQFTDAIQLKLQTIKDK